MSYVAGIVSEGSGAGDTGSGQAKGISDEVDPNPHLQVTAAGNVISGTVTVQCGAGISDCAGLINEMSREVNTTSGDYTINIGFVQTDMGGDILITGKPLPDNIAASSCCFNTSIRIGLDTFAVSGTLNDMETMKIDFTKMNPNTGDLAHEFGHFLGLHHESNFTNGLMSYSPIRLPQFNEDELNRVYNAYTPH